MKILVIEKDLKNIDWENETQTLIDEAKSVYKMLLSGKFREIYFTENKNAVIILECENKHDAEKILNKLPLVKNGIITFDVMELQPYTGFSRLINFE